jgi:hypothetical protein
MVDVLRRVEEARAIIAERADAISRSWNESCRGLSRHDDETEGVIAWAGVDDAHLWIGLPAPDRTPGLRAKIGILLADWRDRLHQETDWGLLHDMAWELGERIASPKGRRPGTSGGPRRSTPEGAVRRLLAMLACDLRREPTRDEADWTARAFDEGRRFRAGPDEPAEGTVPPR